ncbi:cytochrome c [Halorhodospira halochloris]|uniref:cytochrome c n=1 Tax=Halorhodospira halochloris TaxID=1052 RepID=UPI00076F85E8|nr:cytochrome c [Halorhodospira halochloris]MBK1652101.1 hypothetical protein [Halorhodospira halochloris]
MDHSRLTAAAAQQPLLRRIAVYSLCAACALFSAVIATPAHAESRTAIEIPRADQEHCQARMREYLQITTEILWATLDGDMQTVEEKAIQGVPSRYREDLVDNDNDQPNSTLGQGRGEQSGGMAMRGDGLRGAGEGRRGDGGPRHERMEQIMPSAYQAMMHSMHEDFMQMAKDARDKADPQHTQRQLARIKDNCVACHASYKFASEE